MNIIVTSSRTYDRKLQVWTSLSIRLARALAQSDTLLVLHGGAPNGGDLFADEWVTEIKKDKLLAPYVEKLVFYPDWSAGKTAGFRRNARMVHSAERADECLAFVDSCQLRQCKTGRKHYSHGTAHTMALCKDAGIPVVMYRGRV